MSEENLLDLCLFPNHAGLSGAALLRGRLKNGMAIVVKRANAECDLFQRLLGHPLSLEHLLWQDGTLRALPKGIRAATIGSWVNGDTATIVMEDLGSGILGAEHQFTSEEAIALLQRLDRLHRAELSPSTTTQLEPLINTFAPARLRQADPLSEMANTVERGWTAFEQLAPTPLFKGVLALVQDPLPLVAALAACPRTFCHGDIAAVNMAWRNDELVLIDWGQAFIGPAVLDVARFLPSGLIRSRLHPEWFLAKYAEIAGDRFDERALRLSLLATLVWFGWKKALDATDAPDLGGRALEIAALSWWFEAAASGLEELRRIA
jgi:thiamine kinase-like enzyme